MKLIRSLTLIASLCLGVASALATTVIEPTFDQLVKDAQMIFQGTVTNIRSEWVGEGADRHIASYVTFKVDDAIKGKPGREYTLSMLGGTVGDRTMEVADAPKFKVGDRDIVFVENNGSQFVPLVGIMHGRFRVQQDQSGREGVFTNAGAPLSNPKLLGVNDAAATSGAPISPSQLKAEVRTTLQRNGYQLTQ